MTTLRLLRFFAPLAVTSLIAIAAVPTKVKLSQPLQIGETATAAPSQRVRWTPKRKLGTIRSTLSGGRRGHLDTAPASTTCDFGNDSVPTTMTLLVPKSNEGLYTTAANPTFFWHTTTERPVSAQFIMTDPDLAEPIFSRTIQIYHSGVSRITLPPAIALQPDKTYRWAVLLACKGVSGEVYARSFVERVDEPMLLQKVADQSDFDQAVSFADEGIWYDAFDALIRANQGNPGNAALRAELKSLLVQVGGNPKAVAEREASIVRRF
ncbi:DUF928 domain-containing protein [Myxacorys almedinensis]|uniref:DUF928 domain-containing protein n=1 Tax=Myxacorys almedinensis A TaxID=2690445 RepID=A0A8J7Z879_9CYAN|nr:DUF928 domain-containing protein [Myxacorys almedinensis]NDJ18178.1 DUF928 domain-containing protein [Myxacorys almedinensis A]